MTQDLDNITVFSVLSSINYLDFGIIALFLFHIFEFVIIYMFRKTRFYRTFLFCYCIYFYLYSKKIEAYCKSNLELVHFSKDYFDPKGIFLFIFFQLPELVYGAFLFLTLLYDYYKLYKSRKSQNNNNQKAKKN